MLLNKLKRNSLLKITSFFLLFAVTVLIQACGDKEEAPGNDLNHNKSISDPGYARQLAEQLLGKDLKFAYPGNFEGDSTVIEVSSGTEIENKDAWGIKFQLLKEKDKKLVKDFETPLLEGSFTDCMVKKIQFPSFNHELVYYNSQDYFLGSGGGEIFSYIIDFNKKQTFYAHLIAEQGEPVSLFLSKNIKNGDIKNFFLSNFKRDYPHLTVVQKDIDLKY